MSKLIVHTFSLFTISLCAGVFFIAVNDRDLPSILAMSLCLSLSISSYIDRISE